MLSKLAQYNLVINRWADGLLTYHEAMYQLAEIYGTVPDDLVADLGIPESLAHGGAPQHQCDTPDHVH